MESINMAKMIKCIKLGREAEGLDFPPYPGELGKRIFANVSKEAWQQWTRMQTMIINENRLNLADVEHRRYLTEQVEKYFFGGEVDPVQGYVPPQK
jgi:Fe-S cluster biosynthesis and repair protein YggX